MAGRLLVTAVAAAVVGGRGPPTSSSAVGPRATAWDAPTDVSCLGGCDCRPKLTVCIPTAPSKDLAIFEKSLASIARHVFEADAIVVVSRADPAIDDVICRVAAAHTRVPIHWFDEAAGHFPVDYAFLKARINDLSRGSAHAHGGAYAYAVGWYLQQLIKLYCGRALHRAAGPRRGGAPPPAGGGGGAAAAAAAAAAWTASDVMADPAFDTLVVDSDVVFMRNVSFVHAARRVSNKRCRATYAQAFSRESHQQYYETVAALAGADFKPAPDARGRDISGVAHHMVFRSDVLVALEEAVAAKHGGSALWEALVGPEGVLKKPEVNTFSEYQTYFHFARRRDFDQEDEAVGHHHQQAVHVRQLYWANGPGPNAAVDCAPEPDGWPIGAQRHSRLVPPPRSSSSSPLTTSQAIVVDGAAGYDYVAYHSYAKRRPCVYGPAAPAPDAGACFGGGCTYSCFKRRDDVKYKARNRTEVAPRLCAAPTAQPP